MRTLESIWFVSNLAKFRGMAMIGLSFDTYDVSKTVWMDVMEGGSHYIVVVVVICGSDTTCAVVVSVAFCCSEGWCWVSETIGSVIVSGAICVVWVGIFLCSSPPKFWESTSMVDDELWLVRLRLMYQKLTELQKLP